MQRKAILLFCLFIAFTQKIKAVDLDDFTEEQNKTLSSFKYIAPYLYMMNYTNDYYLTELLKSNVTTLRQLESFATTHLGVHDYNVLNEDPYSYQCSGFNFFSVEGTPYTGRNFDYDAEYEYSYDMFYWTHPKDGYASLSTIDLYMVNFFDYIEPIDRLLMVPYYPMDGINEKGLFISILVVAGPNHTDQTDSSKYSIYSPIMVRAVLDKCKNVDEAIELFKKYNMKETQTSAYNYHFYITDADGNAVVIEYVDNEMVIVNSTNEKCATCLSVTNFFLSQPSDENTYGKDRWEIMEGVINDNEGILDWKTGMETLKNVSKSNTLYSNLYNHEGKYVLHAPHLNYTTFYNFSLNKPMEYTIYPPKEEDLDSSSFISRSLFLLILALLIILF